MKDEDRINQEVNAKAVYQDMKYVESLKNELEQLRPSKNPTKEILSYLGSMTLFFGLISYLEVDDQFYTICIVLFLALSVTQSMIVAESKKTNKRIDLLHKLIELPK